MNQVKYGGGSWTCEKCGRTIQGSSIHHDCRPLEYIGEGMTQEIFGKPEDTEPIRPSRRLFDTPHAGISKKGTGPGVGRYRPEKENPRECPPEIYNIEVGDMVEVTMVDVFGAYNCMGKMCKRKVVNHTYRDDVGWYVTINVTINNEVFAIPAYWNTTMKRFEITLS